MLVVLRIRESFYVLTSEVGVDFYQNIHCMPDISLNPYERISDLDLM